MTNVIEFADKDGEGIEADEDEPDQADCGKHRQCHQAIDLLEERLPHARDFLRWRRRWLLRIKPSAIRIAGT